MRLWLFIAESPFYTQYIKCYLSRFLVSYICVFEKITIKNNTTRCVIGMSPHPRSCVTILPIGPW